jgi:capsular polysaccharide biosynthesis protein
LALSDYLAVVRRRWVIVLAAALAGVALAAGYVSTKPDTYVSTTRLYVSMATGTSVNDSLQGALASQQRITSYVLVASGPTVAQRVIDELNLSMSPGELQEKVTATFPPATMLIDLSVADPAPQEARRLAEAVAVQFSEVVGEMETTRPDAAPLAEVTVVDPARTPTQPSGSGPTRFLAVGLLAGLALGCLAALAADRLSRKVRTREQLARAVPAPLLGSLSRTGGGSRDMAGVRARLLSAFHDRGRMVVLFTSFSQTSFPEVALQVAKSLSDSGRSVALVDADTSGRGVTRGLDLVSRPGVGDWLRGDLDTLGPLPRWSGTGVSVLPLGTVDAGTSDLMASTRTDEMLASLVNTFDCVLIDASPMSGNGTASALLRNCDASIAVVELATATRPTLRDAIHDIDLSGTPLLGVVAVEGKASRFPFARRRRAPEPRRRREAVHRRQVSTVVPEVDP